MNQFTTKLIDLAKDILSKDGATSLKSLLNYKLKGNYKVLYFSNEEYEFLGYYSPQTTPINEANILNYLSQGHVIFTALPFDRKSHWQQWELSPYILCDYTFIREKNNGELRVLSTKHEKHEFIAKESNSYKILKETEKPSFDEWETFVNSGLCELKDQNIPLTKFVAARTREISFDQAPNTSQLFNQLHSNSTYHFFLESGALTFMGNSPECLMAARENAYRFDALAGTRPRGKNPEEDQKLESELLTSPKELNEHQQVVNFITTGLNQLGKVTQESSHILKLKSLQHIKTPLNLKADNNSPEILIKLIKRLHPTPAVCGMPKESAMNFLRKYDPIERGMYAGAIGILSSDYSELCVGIRSLLVDQNTSKAILYGGAGIVAPSTPAAEWEETGYKMDSFSPFSIHKKGGV